MRVFLFVVSIFYIAMGTLLVLYSNQTRSFFKEFYSKVNVRLLAIAPFLLGLLLIVAAFKVREVFLLALILGLLAMAKGAYLALGATQQIRQLSEWWFDRAGETTIRLSGLIVFMIGTALFSWLI